MTIIQTSTPVNQAAAYKVTALKNPATGETTQVVAIGRVVAGAIVPYSDADPLVISGTFSASLASASSSSEGRVTAAATSTQILAANAGRKGGRVRVSINSPEPVNISFGGTASASSPLYGPGDIIPLADGAVKYLGALNCYSAAGTGVVEYVEL